MQAVRTRIGAEHEVVALHDGQQELLTAVPSPEELGRLHLARQRMVERHAGGGLKGVEGL